MVNRCIDHKYGKIIYNDDDKNVQTLKEQCEEIVDRIFELFSLSEFEKAKLQFNIEVNSKKFSIPTFIQKNNQKIIRYPRENLNKLGPVPGGLCPNLTHEIIHAICFFRTSMFLSEGLAVSISNILSKKNFSPAQSEKKNQDIFKTLVNRVPIDTFLKLKSLKDKVSINLLSHKYEQTLGLNKQTYYALSGTFFLFLIERYGLNRLGKLLFDDNKSYIDIYQLSEEQLLNQWIDSCLDILTTNYGTSVSCRSLNIFNYEWKYIDDTFQGGNSQITFIKGKEGICIKGRFGNNVDLIGFSTGVSLEKEDIAFSQIQSIKLGLGGSNIELQVWISTTNHYIAGEDNAYVFLCPEEITNYILHKEQFYVLSGSEEDLYNENIKGIGIRAIGNQDEYFEVSVFDFCLQYIERGDS